MKLRRIPLIMVLALPLLQRGAGANDSSRNVCTEDGTKACVDTSTAAVKPAWKMEQERLDNAWKACEPDVAKFCEGIQAGKNRVEKCLDAHAADLSAACQAARAPHSKE